MRSGSLRSSVELQGSLESSVIECSMDHDPPVRIVSFVIRVVMARTNLLPLDTDMTGYL